MLSAEWNAFVLFFNKMTRVVCAIFIGFVTGIIPFHGLLCKMTRVVCAIFIGFVTGIIPFHGLLCATFIRFVTRTIPPHGLLILPGPHLSRAL